jgi:hypothetical protein
MESYVHCTSTKTYQLLLHRLASKKLPATSFKLKIP